MALASGQAVESHHVFSIVYNLWSDSTFELSKYVFITRMDFSDYKNSSYYDYIYLNFGTQGDGYLTYDKTHPAKIRLYYSGEYSGTPEFSDISVKLYALYNN